MADAERRQQERDQAPRDRLLRTQLRLGERSPYDLEVWQRLTLRDQTAFAQALTRDLTSQPLTFLGLETFGPTDDPLRLPIWAHRAGLDFVLIPGGTFQPGGTGSRSRRLEQVVRRHGLPMSLSPVGPPHAPVRLLPYLLARTPVLDGQLGFADSGGFFGEVDPEPGQSPAAYVTAKEANDAVQQCGWRLPSLAELCWAAAGGLDVLFPWGDALLPPDQLEPLLALSFPPRPSNAWPLNNRFGLCGTVGPSTWVSRDADPQLLRFGGAGESFPWQGVDEWFDALTFGLGEASQEDATIRPALSLPTL